METDTTHHLILFSLVKLCIMVLDRIFPHEMTLWKLSRATSGQVFSAVCLNLHIEEAVWVHTFLITLLMFEERSSSFSAGLAGNIHPSSLHSIVGVLWVPGYIQNSLQDTARKKKLDLASVHHNETPGCKSDRCKQVLLACSFQGRASGEYFS